MTQIVLHIGLNKTGTSSIQDFMSMNAPTFLEHGLCYPSTGRDGTAHHALSRWLKTNKHDAAAVESDFARALRAEIESSKLAVLSSEDFHTLDDKGVSLMKALLDGHRVRVVVYFREHLNYLASWYQQNVQGSHLSCAFDTFCYLNKKPLINIADRWAEAFGRRAVSVKVYDRSQLSGGDIVQDFFEQLNIKLSMDSLQRKPNESNPSVSGNLLFAKRLINNFCDKNLASSYVHEVGALAKLKPSFSGHMLVPADQTEWIVRSYKEDRRKIAKRYGAVIPEVSGARSGHLSPDMDTLAEDWKLIIKTAERRNFAIAAAGNYLRLGNFKELPQAGQATAT